MVIKIRKLESLTCIEIWNSKNLNSQAVGWGSWGTLFLIIISCMFFRYYPEIHFYTHFRNLNLRKKFLDNKKISFSKADFYNGID